MKIFGIGIPELLIMCAYLIPIIIGIYFLIWIYRIKKNTDIIAKETQEQTILLKELTNKTKEL